MPIVFLASYPKSGTTWLQSIVYHILHLDNSLDDLTHISHFSPFYENQDTWIGNDLQPLYANHHVEMNLHVFNTHLLPDMIPLESKHTKAIYIMRNARDVVTSFYYHISNQILDEADAFETNFDDFLRQWFNGQVLYGKWIQHIQDWRGVQDNILFLRYEDLLVGLPSIVKQISTFLNVTLSASQIDKVCSRASFSSMKANIRKYQPISVEWKSGFSFIRKGVEHDDSLFADSATVASYNRLAADCLADADERIKDFVRPLL
jgi:hypothetical protein